MRKFKIKKKDRKLWLKALEGGKYKQTNGILKDEKGYCCLGVFGAIKEIPDYELRGKRLPYHLSDENLKKYPKCLISKGDKSFGMKLANMNDNGKSFKEIAKYIKSNTVGV